MEQKITWMHYLVFGISSVIILVAHSCNKDSDYSVKAEWIYINETKHIITYLPENTWNEFNIPSQDTTIYYQNTDGPENVTAESYVPPINAEVVIIDSTKCDTSLAESLKEITSYENRKIGERNYRFIFRFTDKNVSNAIDCK